MDREQQDALYQEAGSALGPAIRRLARGYEADRERQRDLIQDIHFELWRSLAHFNQRCSLRSWVYRIAHNVGASHVMRSRRTSAGLVDLEALDVSQPGHDEEAQAARRLSASELLDLIHRLRPLDRQVILLYLEEETAADVAEVTGLTAASVATRIHRIKKLLKQIYTEGDAHANRRLS
ncbi:MAG TPA: sigma-70 family RNA polymerase sigma factor [Bryobacteraceae bacterium]